TGFQTKSILFSEAVNLFHDVPLLVHLDRVDAAILALVFMLRDRVCKGFVKLADAVLEDVGETDQAGELDVAPAELIDELLEIDARLREFSARVDGDVAFIVDFKIAVPPVANAIKSCRVLHAPWTRRLNNRRRMF